MRVLKAFLITGLAAAMTLIGTAIVAVPGASASVTDATLPTDATSVTQAYAAADRLVTDLTAIANSHTGTAQMLAQEALAHATSIRSNAGGIGIPPLYVYQVVPSVTAPDLSGLSGTVASLILYIQRIDANLLLDDVQILTNFYTTGYVSPCATVSHDLLRLRPPQTFAPTPDDVPNGDAVGAAPAVAKGVAAVAAVLSDCVPGSGYVASDGGISVAGSTVARPMTAAGGFGPPVHVDTSGTGTEWVTNDNEDPNDKKGGPGPSVFDHVNPTDVGRVTYGGYYDTNDGSSLYVTAYFYRPTVRDDFGDTIIVWQSGTASIKEHTNLQKFETYIAPGQANSARFEDYSPAGQNEYEGTHPVTASLEFGLEAKRKDSGGKIGVGVSRDFGVSYTKFGGDLNSDGAHVQAARGGYRHIAQGHRNTSRAFQHTAAWTFPSGVNEGFAFWYDQYAYKR